MRRGNQRNIAPGIERGVPATVKPIRKWHRQGDSESSSQIHGRGIEAGHQTDVVGVAALDDSGKEDVAKRDAGSDQKRPGEPFEICSTEVP